MPAHFGLSSPAAAASWLPSVPRNGHRAAGSRPPIRWRSRQADQLPTTKGKVVNPRAGSRWLFAFAALSELPLEPGTRSSLRYVVA
jgi:hypothetical protein